MQQGIELWQVVVYLGFPLIVTVVGWFLTHFNNRIAVLETDAKADSGLSQRVNDLSKAVDDLKLSSNDTESRVRSLEVIVAKIDTKLDLILAKIGG